MARLSLSEVIDSLEALYGTPKPPKVTDPWQIVLWENVAYLADDQRREKAFQALKQRVGLQPQQILTASDEVLHQIGAHGIVPDQTIAKLRRCAQIALEQFDGDLLPALRYPLPKAKKAFQKFPGFGEPGAEKVLLFSRSYPILALDSNGLRVLLRLGFGEEKQNYSATYRHMQAQIEGELRKDYAWLINAHQLLRQHGQELCKTNRPRCLQCPLARDCPSSTTH